jgi:hypothetical protein
MKVLITLFVILSAVYLFVQLTGFYRRTATSEGRAEEAVRVEHAAEGMASLPGLPPHLEGSLQQAQQQGAEELGKWLRTWGRQVQDPRLASIELDYIVLLNLKDHKAARERFQQLRARVPPDSPVAPRIRKLESAYEQ